MQKYIKVTALLLVCLIAACLIPFSALAYTEPQWNMDYLTSSAHYTDSSGKTWYPATAFYLPQFLTGVENTDGQSTYYETSKNGGTTWFNWNNRHHVGDYLTPDSPPQAGFDYYYQFGAYVTNSDPQYSYVPYYSGKFYIDTNPPTATFSPMCSTDSSTPITVVIGAADSGGGGNFPDDNGSGLNHYIYRTSADNGSIWGAWSGNITTDTTITFSDPGTYQIEVEAWDNVGNMSDWVSGSYVVNEMNAGGTVSNAAGQYRTNTDVITSVMVTNSGGDITPETGASVTFSIPGITSQSKGFVLPAGGSEPVWFMWHTPSTPCNVSATINIRTGSSSQTLTPTFNIYTLEEKTPPVPTGRDLANPYFQYETPPDLATTPSATWTTYSANQEEMVGQIWNAVTDEFDTYTYLVWVYTTNTYYATLSATLKVTPDTYDPTAKEQYGVWTIKSGYGVQENVTTGISTNDSGDVTGAQNVIGYYPEFMYNDTGYDFGGYNRILEMLSGGLSAAFDLKPNMYDMDDSHVHDTPVWFQNGNYQPTTYIEDCWTPAGMLSVQSSDTVNIQGSVFDDWHILPSY
jgi:hypothetical protein